MGSITLGVRTQGRMCKTLGAMALRPALRQCRSRNVLHLRANLLQRLCEAAAACIQVGKDDSRPRLCREHVTCTGALTVTVRMHAWPWTVGQSG